MLIAEIIMHFDYPIDDSDRITTGYYLAKKWGFYSHSFGDNLQFWLNPNYPYTIEYDSDYLVQQWRNMRFDNGLTPTGYPYYSTSEDGIAFVTISSYDCK